MIRNYFSIQSIMIFILISATSLFAQAQVLSEVSLFHRCYGQITQTRAPLDHPLLAQVKFGNLSAIAACNQILSKGLLTANGNTRLANTDDESKAVLRTFHYMHVSWFDNKDIYTGGNDENRHLKNWYDTTAVAAYFTRALFHPTLGLDSVFTETGEIIPVRTVQNPTIGAYSRNEAISSEANVMAPVGDILGVKTLGSRTVASADRGDYPLSRNLGGGILGSSLYMHMNAGVSSGFRANGAVSMPRKWSRSVFKDFLCRNLPVIRAEDANPFVVSGSSTPFRTNAACVRCHASMDRMASNVRNITFTYHQFFIPNETYIVPMTLYTTSQAAEAAWPSESDSNYNRRPTNGVLYYRAHDGTLINESTTGPADLGQKLLAHDDFYNCVASRYYHYFMGINVNVSDIADPTQSVTLNGNEMTHRDRVINLGQQLKGHKSLMQLVQDIMGLDDYKKENFGVQ